MGFLLGGVIRNQLFHLKLHLYTAFTTGMKKMLPTSRYSYPALCIIDIHWKLFARILSICELIY